MPYIHSEMIPEGTAYYHAKRRKRRTKIIRNRMNYQRKLRRTAITRRVILLLCIAAAAGVIIGGMIGYAVGKRAACMEKETGQAYSGMTIETENTEREGKTG